MTKRNHSLFLGLLVVLSAMARAVETPHYSVKDVPISTKSFPEQKRSMYIGEYGESFTYEMEWVLHPPMLRDGIEVVRFHSMLTNPPDETQIKDSDFRAENFTPLNLVELVVMPKSGAQFKSLGELRDAKAAALTAKSAVFEIGSRGDGKWPESTFDVTVSSPYALYQRYAESDGQVFILTTGVKGVGRDAYTAAGDFVGALGDYFYRLQPPNTPIERQRFGDMKLLAFPLFVIGLILLSIPWARSTLFPLGAAAFTASILGSALKIGAFYLGRWLDTIGHGSLVSPGPIGWVALPLFGAAIYFRARNLSRPRRWIVVGFAVVATGLVIVVGAAMHDMVVRGEDSIVSAFDSFMFYVGLFYGGCLGLSMSRRAKAGGGLIALVLLTSYFSSTASAQIGAPAERLEAIRHVDADKFKPIFEKMQATKELRDTRDLNDYQCVELDGIIATDETAPKFRKYFDLHLQPAHNNDRKYHPIDKSDESQSWWQRVKDSAGTMIGGIKGVNDDIADLWDDKTGKMTERGKEILGPIADRNIHVNTIVAHSWGAVLLQNAIRTGVVAPPRKIIIVGLPDKDLEKWKLLAHFTGTNVTIVANSEDMAVALAKFHDALKDMNVNGAGKRYDEGTIANEWQHWRGNNPDGNPLKLEGAFMARALPMGKSDTGGHGREGYYQQLVAEGELLRTADEMKQDQDGALDERFQELREQDIEIETSIIMMERSGAPGGHDLQDKQAMGERLKQRMDSDAAQNNRNERQRSWQLALDVRTISLKACKSPDSVSDEDVARVREIETAVDYSSEDRLSADMAGCEKSVFDRIVELARSNRLGSGLTPDFVRMLGSYYAPRSPAPIYSPLPAPRPERGQRQKDPCRDNGNHYCP